MLLKIHCWFIAVGLKEAENGSSQSSRISHVEVSVGSLCPPAPVASPGAPAGLVGSLQPLNFPFVTHNYSQQALACRGQRM